ncbi:MAG: S41 family peptidase, partial [Clostridiales bacterium]|nr:S41 family peptidase [Clostridiales bacterium]
SVALSGTAAGRKTVETNMVSLGPVAQGAGGDGFFPAGCECECGQVRPAACGESIWRFMQAKFAPMEPAVRRLMMLPLKALQKIGEGDSLPTWEGGAWPGYDETHSHANKAVLDVLSGAGGALSYGGEELAAAVQKLKTQGMKALLLDLRYCPGGEMEGAVETCGVLAGNGPMVFFKDKSGWYSFIPVEGVQPLGLPLALLINGETASAAELVAANVQDSGAGILIGVPSYGKGVMQQVVDLPSGAGIKFTTGKFITHAYQDIDAAGGVMPDIYIAEEEAQRNKALSWLKEQAAKASMLKFYVGLAGYSLGGAWQAAAVEALLEDGTSYVPMELTLAQLGWSREERDGIVYFSRGTHRLIADKAGLSLIMGSGAHKLVSRGETLYMPAAALRQYGYTVTWDGAERSVRIER